jgi:DNA-binding response OmpR family regulator|nr:response regulator [Kofleriaceae bacterium]
MTRILLVEDDREMRVLLARHLRRNGYEVIEAWDGIAALARLGDAICACGRSGFDVMVSDVRMPGHSGLELLHELRRCDWAMPVVLITAFATNAMHDEAKKLGAHMLDKPFEFEALTTTLEQLVS